MGETYHCIQNSGMYVEFLIQYIDQSIIKAYGRMRIKFFGKVCFFFLYLLAKIFLLALLVPLPFQRDNSLFSRLPGGGGEGRGIA